MGTFQHGDPRLPDRFWAKVWVNPATGCWEWTAALDSDGYPSWFFISGKGPTRVREKAHRLAYQRLVGPIPVERPTINHQCHVLSCVNPSDGHACEPMTAGENAREAKARRTHCTAGHPYSLSNTRWVGPLRDVRQCIACYTAREARKAARPAAGQLTLV